MAESTQLVKLRKGATSQIFYVELRDSTATTGAFLTGLVFGGLTAIKIEWNVDAAVVGLTEQDIAALGTYAAPTSNAHIRFKETAGLAGLYEVQIHDDWLDAEGNITLIFSGANVSEKRIDILVEDTAREDTVEAISTTGVTINAAAESRVLTGGTTEVGVFGNTEQLDGVYHEINDNAGTTDMHYVFDIGSEGIPTGVHWTGYMFSNDDDMDVYAMNWGTGWELIGNIDGKNPSVNEVHEFTLFPKHVGTAGDLGAVHIRFEQTGLTSSELQTDQIIIQYAVVNRSAGYADGSIWVDTNSGVAGTTNFINGTADNPVLTWGDALTLAAALNIFRFHIINGSLIQLSANSDNYTLLGDNWTLDLNTQSIAGIHVSGATVSGVGTGSLHEFVECLIGTTTLADGRFINCGLTDILTLSAAASYFIDLCYSGIAGTATPTIDFGAAVVNTALNLRNYSGGIEITNMNGAGADTMSLEGFGQLVINATCSAGGTIAIRGHFTITDNVGGGGFVASGGTLSDDARYTMSEQSDSVWDEDVTGHITANSAGAALDALGTAIDGRANNATLDALLAVPDVAANTIAETLWDEDIVAAHGTADTSGLLLRALGAEISQRTNNLTLNDLLGVPDTAATDTVAGQVWEETVAGHNVAGSMGEVMNDIVAAGFPSVVAIADGVWDEDIVAAHGTADTGGLLLRALGALISQRANNATLNALLAVPDVAANTIAETLWDEDITTHVTASSAGAALEALGTAIDGRTNNANLNALLGVADTATYDIAYTIWDELTASHAVANSAGQRLQALDVLLEASGAGDAAAILTQANKLDATALAGSPHADSVAGKLNALSATLATVDRDIVTSLNIEGSNLRIEAAVEQYGLIQTTPYTQCSAQIFNEANGIVATIGVADFGAITARGFFQNTLTNHPLVAGATYQIQILMDDGVGGTYQNSKLLKIVNV